jgi:DNA-directed RNA polymerase I, II, and III subunit RPABC2
MADEMNEYSENEYTNDEYSDNESAGETKGDVSEDEEEEDNHVKITHDYRDGLLSKHPEVIQPNYDEIRSRLIIDERENENGQIEIDPNHTTMPFLTKFEKARVLGLRTKQLNNGAVPLVEVPAYVKDNRLIAEMELRKRVLPFIIVRPMPNGESEYWRLSDLEIIWNR